MPEIGDACSWDEDELEEVRQRLRRRRWATDPEDEPDGLGAGCWVVAGAIRRWLPARAG